MKKLVALSLAAMLIICIAGCAGNAKQGMRVKCPACGYEFQPPSK